MTERTRRDLLRAAAALSLAGCARRISPERAMETSAAVDGNVTVALADAPELARSGGAVLVRAAGEPIGILLVNSGTGFLALSARCPHAGCDVTWVPEDREAECPCHGSRFAGDGTLLHPPARADLASYPVTASAGALVIHLFAGDGVFKNPVKDGQFSFAIADYPALQSPGGAVSGRPDGFPSPLVVARIDAGAVAAVSAVCSHLGCNVLPSRSILRCPCHGSQFDLGGRLLQGPAGSDLLRYRVVSFDGATATVSTQILP
jgi:Rieske Fe-S protein